MVCLVPCPLGATFLNASIPTEQRDGQDNIAHSGGGDGDPNQILVGLAD